MKKFKLMYLTIALLGITIVSSSVWSHNRFNFGLNMGYYNPGYYNSYGFGYYDPFFYSPFYSYPPIIVVPSTPPVYIQQEKARQSAPAQPRANYWHYCQDPEGYYPYVRQCPGGWLQVAPQPAQ